jgi:hypothetical protein
MSGARRLGDERGPADTPARVRAPCESEPLASGEVGGAQRLGARQRAAHGRSEAARTPAGGGAQRLGALP